MHIISFALHRFKHKILFWWKLLAFSKWNIENRNGICDSLQCDVMQRSACLLSLPWYQRYHASLLVPKPSGIGTAAWVGPGTSLCLLGWKVQHPLKCRAGGQMYSAGSYAIASENRLLVHRLQNLDFQEWPSITQQWRHKPTESFFKHIITSHPQYGCSTCYQVQVAAAERLAVCKAVSRMHDLATWKPPANVN